MLEEEEEESTRRLGRSIISFLELESSWLSFSLFSSVDDKDDIEIAIECLKNIYGPEELNDINQRPLQEIFLQASNPVSIKDRLSAESVKEEGHTNMANGQYDVAEQDYSRALELDSYNAIFYCDRASARLRLKKYYEAIRDCKEALAYNPDYARAYEIMGHVFASREYHTRAARCFRLALELEPDNETYRSNLSVAEQQVAANPNLIEADSHMDLLMEMFSGLGPDTDGSSDAEDILLDLNWLFEEEEDEEEEEDDIFDEYLLIEEEEEEAEEDSDSVGYVRVLFEEVEEELVPVEDVLMDLRSLFEDEVGEDVLIEIRRRNCIGEDVLFEVKRYSGIEEEVVFEDQEEEEEEAYQVSGDNDLELTETVNDTDSAQKEPKELITYSRTLDETSENEDPRKQSEAQRYKTEEISDSYEDAITIGVVSKADGNQSDKLLDGSKDEDMLDETKEQTPPKKDTKLSKMANFFRNFGRSTTNTDTKQVDDSNDTKKDNNMEKGSEKIAQVPENKETNGKTNGNQEK